MKFQEMDERLLRWSKRNKDKSPRGGFYYYPTHKNPEYRDGKLVVGAKTNPYLEYSEGSMHGCFIIPTKVYVDELISQKEVRRYLIDYFSTQLLRPRAIVVVDNAKGTINVEFHLLFREIPEEERLVNLYDTIKDIVLKNPLIPDSE